MTSVDWIRDAAVRGVPDAQVLYGQLLLDGHRVERSPLHALHWFERAALSGHAEAMNMVGRCLDQGWGMPADAASAERWFRAAAERGSAWGMYNLATLLTLGKGVPQNRAAALCWFRKAAALGHVKSLNIVGGFYEDGWEVPRDLETARDHYRRAARGGDFRGQFNYARLLAGEGRVNEAYAWLDAARSSGTDAFIAKMTEYLLGASSECLREYGRRLRAGAVAAGNSAHSPRIPAVKTPGDVPTNRGVNGG